MHMAHLIWVAWAINLAKCTGATGNILKDPRIYGGDPSLYTTRGKKSLVTFRISDTFIP